MGETMIKQNNSLLGKLEDIKVNDQEQIFINKAIRQLKDEKQSEKIVIKGLIHDFRSVIINNQKLSDPALNLFNEISKPNLGFAKYLGMFGHF